MSLNNQPDEEHDYAKFLTSWRSVSINRTRLADGALLWSLPSTVWRYVGPLSHWSYPGSSHVNANLRPSLHERDYSTLSRLLEGSHVAFEAAVLDHPLFYNNSQGLARLTPPSQGGYSWVILPSVDALSDFTSRCCRNTFGAAAR